MKNVKKHPTKQLERFSTIFMQLSLVLVLFITYQVIEYETKIDNELAFVFDDSYEYSFPEEFFVEFVKEKKAKPKVVKKQPFIIDEVKLIKDNEKIAEIILEDKIEETPAITIDKALDLYIPEDPEIKENVDFIIIEDAPIFSGCEGLPKEENKKCFVQKIQKFVLDEFDAELAQELGLNAGKYKIFTQFAISNKGNVTDIKVKAPHPKLKKELEKIASQLPKFIPGKQRGRPVKVTFTLPVTFTVE